MFSRESRLDRCELIKCRATSDSVVLPHSQQVVLLATATYRVRVDKRAHVVHHAGNRQAGAVSLAMNHSFTYNVPGIVSKETLVPCHELKPPVVLTAENGYLLLKAVTVLAQTVSSRRFSHWVSQTNVYCSF